MNKNIFYSILFSFSVANAMESGSIIEFNLGKPGLYNAKALVSLSLMDESIQRDKYDGKVTFVVEKDNCLMQVNLFRSLKFDSENYEAYSHIDKLNNASSKRLLQTLKERVSVLNTTCVGLVINESLDDSTLRREVIVEVDNNSVNQLVFACGLINPDKKDSISREDSFSYESLSENSSENSWFSSYKWPVSIVSVSVIFALCLYCFKLRT